MRKEDISERLVKLMADPLDRQRYGSTHCMKEETKPLEDVDNSLPQPKYLRRLEKQQHTELENWLNQHQLFYVHSRMDRETSNRKGIPDFVIGLRGWMVCIEFKVPGRTLTPEQEEWRRRAEAHSRVHYHICATGAEAIRLLQDLAL